jgi:hypothetical protein
VRIEFHRPAEPVEPPATTQPGPPAPPPPPLPAVASASWQDGNLHVEADDPELAAALRRAFRPTPVVVDDPALRYPGTRGASLLQPGDLEWVRAVALVRVPEETGLVPRFVSGVVVGGFDPAANYRRFPEQIERLTGRSER